MAQRLQVVTTGVSGSPFYNNFYGVGATPTTAVELSDAVFALFDSLNNFLTNTVDVTFSGDVERFDVTTGQTTSIDSVGTWTVDGSWGTAQAIPGNCILLQWRTSTYANGRLIRGRSFIGGLGDFAQSDGTIAPSTTSTLDLAAQAYADVPNTAVYSPTNATAVTIATGTSWNKFALMRSHRD